MESGWLSISSEYDMNDEYVSWCLEISSGCKWDGSIELVNVFTEGSVFLCLVWSLGFVCFFLVVGLLMV